MRGTLKVAGYSLMAMFVSCGVGAQDFTTRSPIDRAAVSAASEPLPTLNLFDAFCSQYMKRSR